MRRRHRARYATVAAVPRAIGARQESERHALQGRVHRTGAGDEVRLPGRHPSSSSHWHCFSTASADASPFRFIYLGDAQQGLGKRWPEVVRAAFAAAPDARFVAHAGDLLDEGYDDGQWRAWLAGLGDRAAELPGVPVPGNHDVMRSRLSRVAAVPDLWNAHFALPANGPADLPELAGQSYYLDYQGVRIVALDVNAFANEDFRESQRSRVQAAQLTWLREVLGANPQRWTIVVQHYPMYSVAKHRDFGRMRAALGALYDEFGVDLVLQGHDHAYGRTHKVYDGRVVDSAVPRHGVCGLRVRDEELRRQQPVGVPDGPRARRRATLSGGVGGRRSADVREPRDGRNCRRWVRLDQDRRRCIPLRQSGASVYRGWFGSLIPTILRASLCSASGRIRMRPLSSVTPC